LVHGTHTIVYCQNDGSNLGLTVAKSHKSVLGTKKWMVCGKGWFCACSEEEGANRAMDSDSGEDDDDDDDEQRRRE